MYVSGDSTQMFTKNPSHPFKRHCFSNYRLYLYRVSSVTVYSHTPWATLLECWYRGKILCLAVQSPPVNACYMLVYRWVLFIQEWNMQQCTTLSEMKIPEYCILRDCLTIVNKGQCNIAINPNIHRDCPQVQNFKHWLNL